MEKLKIYVTARVAEILEKDAEGFEFFKRDGRTLNKNALLTRLVVNYYNQFAREQSALMQLLKARIAASAQLAPRALDSLCAGLCETLGERNAAPEGENFGALVSLKPTKDSEPVLEYIERYELAGRTLSAYFRGMFASYAALPQDKREEIIFKPQFDAVMRAIREKKRIFVTMNNDVRERFELSPYTIARSKEELHLYVVGAAKSCTTVRLSRISSVRQLTAEASFTPAQLATIGKMLKYGPQFIYRANEGEAMVELTARGIKKFQKMYVHRPVPTRINNNCFYFDCSHMQLVQYFVRFGEDAKIVYPKHVADEVYGFHRRALERYKKIP